MLPTDPAGLEERSLTHTTPAQRVSPIDIYAVPLCSRNIEMAPLCNLEMTLFRVSGSREKRHDGAVDEQAGIQPA